MVMAKGKYEKWLKKDNLLLLEAWARDGLTDETIAKNMGVGLTTLYRWKAEHREIWEALKRGKEIIDIEVENALLKSALGYEDIEIEITTDFSGNEIKKEKRKQVPPNTTALIFWLKNRQPKKWRDKQDIEVSKSMDDSIKEIEDYLNGKDFKKENT